MSTQNQQRTSSRRSNQEVQIIGNRAPTGLCDALPSLFVLYAMNTTSTGAALYESVWANSSKHDLLAYLARHRNKNDLANWTQLLFKITGGTRFDSHDAVARRCRSQIARVLPNDVRCSAKAQMDVRDHTL